MNASLNDQDSTTSKWIAHDYHWSREAKYLELVHPTHTGQSVVSLVAAETLLVAMFEHILIPSCHSLVLDRFLDSPGTSCFERPSLTIFRHITPMNLVALLKHLGLAIPDRPFGKS